MTGEVNPSCCPSGHCMNLLSLPSHRSTCRLQKSLAGARAAAEEAARQRQAILQQRDSSSNSSSDSATIRGHKQQGKFGGSPALWRRSEGYKSLGRQAEATLESVFARTQWPSDEVVASLWDLHRLPRERVVAWFAERRRQLSARSKQHPAGESGRGGRASRGQYGGGAGGWGRQQQRGSTDWDAEWGSGDESQ